MKRSLSFWQRAKCTASGQLVDVLVMFFGRAPVDMTVIDGEIQKAIKIDGPAPDAILMLSFGATANALSGTWKANGERASALISRGRSENFHYLKELTIWKFLEGDFQLLHRDKDSTENYEFNIQALILEGLAWLVDQRKAFQVAPSGHVFRHPSKRQTRHFLLASELVKDELDVYFVGLCICSVAWTRLANIDVLHIDTMGIYAIARAVEDIATCSGGQTCGSWRIESFHSHDGISLLHTVTDEKHAVLISASTTGSMAAKLAESGAPKSALITILEMSDQNRQGTVVYAREKHIALSGRRPNEAVEAQPGETVIELTGEYFVATAKKPRAFVLTKDHKPAALQHILAHFSHADACRLNSSRNNGSTVIDLISINEDLIGTDQKLQDWIAAEIQHKTPSSVNFVLSLPGTGSNTIANCCAGHIEKYTSRRPRIIQQADLLTINPNDVFGVMVCTALAGNGHALRTVSRDLRETVPNAARHFLIGVGAPYSDAAWTRLRQFLTQSGNPARPYLMSSWQVIPTGAESGKGEAWARATALMQKTEQMPAETFSSWSAGDVTDALRLAGNLLENASSGFLPTTSNNSLKLTRGFVFWDPKPELLAQADHAAVSYLAIASALQNAREYSDPSRKLCSSLHETVVLDPENFLRFNDGVLQASLLRASYAHELDYSAAPELSEIMREFLEKVFLNHARSYGEASLEFAFALASGHLCLTEKDKRILLDRVLCHLTPNALLGLLYCFDKRSF